ncbi:MAG: hypothetical protein LBV30_01370 [Propionibacteriaceae bacterium]|jgi:hypothetical protein|nr:hypothetical protein [Propionibacteriaceae bacterium]
MPPPALLGSDPRQRILVKEFVTGQTLAQLVLDNRLQPDHVNQMGALAALVEKAGWIIDYFPTNFVDDGTCLIYIDGECHPYDPKEDFGNWDKQWLLEPDRLLLVVDASWNSPPHPISPPVSTS